MTYLATKAGRRLSYGMTRSRGESYLHLATYRPLHVIVFWPSIEISLA